jgi:host factor-I protein
MLALRVGSDAVIVGKPRMKDPGNPAAVGRAPEPAPKTDEFVNRKLIRPSLPMPRRSESGGENPLTSSEQRVPKRANAIEQTHAEAFYFQKQMASRTPMVVVLKDGEEVHGWIDWYDRNCIKINRNGHPSVLIYKQSIRYMFKAGENNNGKR